MVASTDQPRFAIVKELLFHVFMSHSGTCPGKALVDWTIPSTFCSLTSKHVGWLGSHFLHQSSQPEVITNVFPITIFTVTTVKRVVGIKPEVWDGWVVFM